METWIDVVEAWERLAVVRPLGAETVPLERASGRVLARSVVADRDFPPFDRAAMDGFAVRAADTSGAGAASPVVLPVAGEATPGRPLAGPLAGRAAVRIMTGAPVPPGCDAVVPVERTSGFEAESVAIRMSVQPGDNVTRRAAERRAGAAYLPAGHRLRPADVGGLAAVGAADVVVGRRANVAVLATGDELVPHERVPGPAQIRNSNGPMLAALAAPGAAGVRVLGIAPDDPEALARAVREGLESDVLLVSGGISMGLYDHVAGVLAATGVRFHFRSVALQPGKPTGFGTHPSGIVLALPGNPISALTTFRLFAAFALARLEGEPDPRPRWEVAPAGFAWTRRNPKWLVLPGRRDAAGVVERTAYAGSGDLLAYAEADCQIVLPPSRAAVQPGEMVSVWPL